jgi:hypothetical protein
MDAFVFQFTAKQLRNVSRDYIGFPVASSHCCNELVILLPYIMYEHDIRRANDFETAFILTRKFTVDGIIISKIFEYWKLCLKFFKQNEASSDPFFSELNRAFDPIAAEIKAAKWVAILRNKISFHYDQKHALSALDGHPDDHPLRRMAGRLKGLTLFEFAEEISSRPILEEAGNGDIGKGMEVVNTFLVQLVNKITRFHADATGSIFAAYGMLSAPTKMKLRNKYCAAPGEVRIPISISSAHLKTLKSKRSTKKRKVKRQNRRLSDSATRDAA